MYRYFKLIIIVFYLAINIFQYFYTNEATSLCSRPKYAQLLKENGVTEFD